MLVPFSPPPGINSDDSTFAAEGRWADGDGFRFRLGHAETVGGTIEMSGAAPTVRANKMLAFNQGGTIKLVVAGDTLRAAALNSTGSDITPASGWTTTVGIRRCIQMFGDTILASVSGGKLFKSNGSAQAIQVAAAPNQITCMIVTPTRQVMALGCNEEGSGTFNPRCIRWCDIENFDDWTSMSTNNSGEYILPAETNIISGCVCGDHVIVWTESDIWLGQFIGDPAQTFAFTRVGNIGIAGLDAFASYRHTLYWMAPDRGVYAYQVGSIVHRVPCPMSNEFPQEASTNPQIFACAVPRYGEIWFAVPVGASGPNRYYVYCADETASHTPVWFRGNFSLGGFSIAGAMVDSPLLVDGLADSQTTTIVHAAVDANSKPYRWDCARTPSIAGFGMPGAYIQSADFYLDGAERRIQVQGIAPDFEALTGAVNLTAYVRDRPMAEPVARGPYLLATSTALASCLVNDNVASGDSQVTVDTNAEAMAAGTLFTFAGVNGWDGSDTGFPARFTVATDYPGGDGTIAFTPAIVSSGPGRNVVALPANNAALLALTRASKKDFRASGRIFAFRFETAGPFRVRFGKPLFDVVPLGAR